MWGRGGGGGGWGRTEDGVCPAPCHPVTPDLARPVPGAARTTARCQQTPQHPRRVRRVLPPCVPLQVPEQPRITAPPICAPQRHGHPGDPQPRAAPGCSSNPAGDGDAAHPGPSVLTSLRDAHGAGEEPEPSACWGFSTGRGFGCRAASGEVAPELPRRCPRAPPPRVLQHVGWQHLRAGTPVPIQPPTPLGISSSHLLPVPPQCSSPLLATQDRGPRVGFGVWPVGFGVPRGSRCRRAGPGLSHGAGIPLGRGQGRDSWCWLRGWAGRCARLPARDPSAAAGWGASGPQRPRFGGRRAVVRS